VRDLLPYGLRELIVAGFAICVTLQTYSIIRFRKKEEKMAKAAHEQYLEDPPAVLAWSA
jgi:hypothetical protein